MHLVDALIDAALCRLKGNRMNDWLKGRLMACEGNLDASIGRIKSWDGVTALHLFNEIEHVHGRLWTSYTSRHNLEKARELSRQQPKALLWDSSFIRELVCSIIGRDMSVFTRESQ